MFPFSLRGMCGQETEIFVFSADSSQHAVFMVHKEQNKAGLAALGFS